MSLLPPRPLLHRLRVPSRDASADGSRAARALRRILAGLVLAAGVLAHNPAFAQGGASVYLQVVDSLTGTPLPGAIVRLNGVFHAVTDTTGQVFLAGLEPGRHQVEVAMLGRRTVSPEIEIAGDEVMHLEVVLVEEAVQLDTVDVTTPRGGGTVGSGGRGRRGGRRIGREQIADSRVQRLSELLVRIGTLQTDGRLRQGQCLPRVVADGIVMGQTSVDIFPVQDLEAVEIFSNGEVPPEFGGTVAAGCGVIVLWTRHK